MPRSILLVALALAVALTPPAHALGSGTPLLDVGVGPNGPVNGASGEPYYLLAHVGAPEAPHDADEKADCSFNPERPGARPPPLESALLSLAAEVASWDPASEPRVSGWYPRCFAGTLLDEHAPVWGRVSYDVPTGRYYVEIEGDITSTGGVLPVGAAAAMRSATTLVRLTGTTGIGTEADCEGCPPPTLV